MGSMNFPASPTNGDVFDKWIYNGTTGSWDLQETGGAAVTISATAPDAPLAEGELWLKRDSDLMLIYDGDVWFEFPSTGGGGGATTLDGLTDVSTTGVTPKQTIAYNGTSWAVDSYAQSIDDLTDGVSDTTSSVGLGTGALLSDNVAELPIVNGEIEIKNFEPDFGALEVAPDRFEWWKNRIMRVGALL